MIPKGTKLYSILFMKCPRCHESDLFKNRNPYKIKGFFEMPKSCSNCGQKFELEPAFYYGAMYVSYAVGIAYMVSVFVALMVLYPDFSLILYLILAVGGMLVLTPIFFRVSRSIWINFFVSYDKEAGKLTGTPKA
ncbi:MAG: DUF983 domain-containing protein [Crocinitomicaceae bacterium]|nr:DUF983 domain-containing protein [Crocinitomicaceae bacterium]